MLLIYTARVPLGFCCQCNVRWRRQPAVHRLKAMQGQWSSAVGKKTVTQSRGRCAYRIRSRRVIGQPKAAQAYVASLDVMGDDDEGDEEVEEDDKEDNEGDEGDEEVEEDDDIEEEEEVDEEDSGSTTVTVGAARDLIGKSAELLKADEAPSSGEVEQVNGLIEDSDLEDTDILKGEQEATVVDDINDFIDEYGYYPEEEAGPDKKDRRKAFVKEKKIQEDPPIDPNEEWYYRDMEREERDLAEVLEAADYEILAKQFRENFPDLKISGMQSNWDKVQEGDLYFCERTELYDGFGFIGIALENGAAAVACEPREDGLEEDELSIDEVPYLIFADLPDAMARMACAYYGNPSSHMNVIGVTGTTGKTTVSWLIRSILEKHGKTTGMMCDTDHSVMDNYLDLDGNIWKSDEVDVARTRDSATPYHIAPYTGRYWVDETLPNPLQVQKLLMGMASRGAEYCVIECPSFYLAQTHLQYIEFTLAVFTNLDDETVDNRHESFEGYKAAKGKLFQSLDDPSRQRAIINLDGDHAEDFVKLSSNVPVVTYSMYPGADVHVVHAKYTMWDTELVIHTPLGRMRVVTGLVGKDNVENVLAAVAAGISINIPLQDILEGLEALEAVPGRMEVIDEGQEPPFAVVVDNANTPKRLEKLLDNARNSGVKRILLVMGCKGCENTEIRAKMMEIAHFKAHMVFVTTDSPRLEHPKAVIDDIMLGIPESIRDQYSLWVYNPFQDPGRVPWWFEEYLRAAQNQSRRYVVEDRSLAIRAAIGTAQEGDVVVIAGRGDEDFQEFPDETGDEIITGWFDDRFDSRDALKKLRYLQNTRMDRKEIPWKSLDK